MAFLNRWDPFTEIARLQDEMSRQLTPSESRNTGFLPPVDIYEDKEGIYVHAELPGVKPEDVKVHVENNILTLSGERKFEHEEKKDGVRRVERSYGSFTRSFALPSSVQGTDVAADLTNGVLSVKLPKKAEVQPRRVTVTSGQGTPRPVAKS